MPYNWKTSVDAFNETYHVVQTHPELTSWIEDLDIQIDCYDKHNRYLVPFGTPSSHIKDKKTITAPKSHNFQEDKVKQDSEFEKKDLNDQH